jgi:hypothetical protein
VQANLQGLDWPTIRVDHHYTGRLVSDLCVVSSVGVRLNTYEHVLSAESCRDKYCRVRGASNPLLTLASPPVPKKKTQESLLGKEEFVARMSTRLPCKLARAKSHHEQLAPRFPGVLTRMTPYRQHHYRSLQLATCPRTRRQTRLQTHVTGSSGKVQAHDQASRPGIPVSHPLMDRLL